MINHIHISCLITDTQANTLDWQWTSMVDKKLFFIYDWVDNIPDIPDLCYYPTLPTFPTICSFSVPKLNANFQDILILRSAENVTPCNHTHLKSCRIDINLVFYKKNSYHWKVGVTSSKQSSFMYEYMRNITLKHVIMLLSGRWMVHSKTFLTFWHFGCFTGRCTCRNNF